MKYCIIFCLLIGTVFGRYHDFTKKTVEDIKQARVDCLEKYPLSQEILDHFKKYEYPEEEIVENYAHCMGKTLYFFVDVEGYIDEHLEIQFGSDKTPIINKCITFKKDHPDWTLGKWALSDWKCLVKEGLLTEEFKAIKF